MVCVGWREEWRETIKGISCSLHSCSLHAQHHHHQSIGQSRVSFALFSFISIKACVHFIPYPLCSFHSFPTHSSSVIRWVVKEDEWWFLFPLCFSFNEVERKREEKERKQKETTILFSFLLPFLFKLSHALLFLFRLCLIKSERKNGLVLCA